MSEHTLIARVRRAELNFERLVEILEDRGYVTELDKEEECGFGSASIEVATQEDFDALFSILFPGRLNDISLSTEATDKGGPRGAYTYALFNTKTISRKEIQDILEEENRKMSS